MVLQFEIFSQAQDAKALHLLQVPWLVALHEGAAGPLRLKVWRGGKRKEVKAPSLSEVVAKIQRKNLNYVDIYVSHADYKGRSYCFAEGGELLLSPTNKMWSNPSDWVITSSDQVREARGTTESKDFVRRIGAPSCPNFVHFSVMLPRMTMHEAFDWVEQQFLGRVEEEFASCFDYGCAILYREPEEDETSYPLLPFISTRSPIFRQYVRESHLLSLLGECFDTLHPILIGRSPLCAKVAESVESCGYDDVRLSEERFGFRVLRLPLEAVNDPKAQEAAAPYLLPPPTPFDRDTMG